MLAAAGALGASLVPRSRPHLQYEDLLLQLATPVNATQRAPAAPPSNTTAETEEAAILRTLSLIAAHDEPSNATSRTGSPPPPAPPPPTPPPPPLPPVSGTAGASAGVQQQQQQQQQQEQTAPARRPTRAASPPPPPSAPSSPPPPASLLDEAERVVVKVAETASEEVKEVVQAVQAAETAVEKGLPSSSEVARALRAPPPGWVLLALAALGSLLLCCTLVLVTATLAFAAPRRSGPKSVLLGAPVDDDAFLGAAQGFSHRRVR